MNKKYIPTAIAVLACVLVAVCLGKISALEKSIDELHSTIYTQFSQTNSSVYDVYRQMSELMEKGENLLTQSDWEYGEINTDKKEVELICSVTPKTCSDNTKAYLVCDEKRWELIKNGAQFKGTISVSVFEEKHIKSVEFQDGDMTYTQALDWYITPRGEVLPMVFANFNGNGTGSADNGIFKDSRKGLITIDINGSSINKIKSASLLYIEDGEEIKRSSIDLSYEAQVGYTQKQKSNTTVAMPVYDAYASGDYSQLYYYLDTEREIKAGSTLELYVEVEDDFGFYYRALCDIVKIDSQGRWDDADYYWMSGMEAAIYSKDGELLYSPNT